MKNLILMLALLPLSALSQGGGGCVYMLPDSTIACLEFNNAGIPAINACFNAAAAAGAIPFDYGTLSVNDCASWYSPLLDSTAVFYGGTGNCAGGFCVLLTLPIELNYFNGNCNRLFWQTNSEFNNSHFSIEKSKDGEEFVYLIEVPGAGSTASIQNYSYTLPRYTGYNYYRISQVDFNGVSETFNTIYLDCEVEDKVVLGYYDMMGREINIDTFSGGHFIAVFEDGSTERKYSN